MHLNFLKKLQVFGVLFGAKARKLTGLRDGSNFIDTPATATTDIITLTNPQAFLQAGGYFRISGSATANDGVLFKIRMATTNVVAIDDSFQALIPFTGTCRIDARIATVQNNPLYSKLDTNGNTIFNASITNMIPTGQPYDLSPVMASHYHDDGGVGPVGKDFVLNFLISDWIVADSGANYKLVVSHNLGTLNPGIFIYEGVSLVRCHKEQAVDGNTVELYVTKQGADARFSGRVRVEKS